MSVHADRSTGEVVGTASGLHQCECKVKLYISPAYLMDPMAGVHDQLSRMLLKYSAKLHGVPLAFQEVTLTSHSGVIRHDEPNIHLQVSTRVLLFAPVVGQELLGTVTRIGSDHVALLVHGAFNASIAKQPDVSDSAVGRLATGERISFVLKSITVADGLLSMLGELPGASNGDATDAAAKGARKGKQKQPPAASAGATPKKKK